MFSFICRDFTLTDCIICMWAQLSYDLYVGIVYRRHRCYCRRQADKQVDRQIYRETDRQMDRWTDRQMDRWTDRQMRVDRHTDRQTDRQTDKHWQVTCIGHGAIAMANGG